MTGTHRFSAFMISVLDPRSYVHVFRLIHYYGYSHVRERCRIAVGQATRISPNVSIRNGVRVRMGDNCQIGERCYLWAGDTSGTIFIGNDVSLAPEVFITASNYQFVAGVPFRHQTKMEKNVWIGDDVWLGTKVVVTAGVSIGNGCIIGAGAVVTKDLPAGTISGGVPARVIGYRKSAIEQPS